jgi:hypothetical protein
LTEPGEDRSLVVLVSDTEAALETFVMPVMSQQVCAEGVDGPPLHELRGRAEVVQSRANLLGGLVREREGTDAPMMFWR